MRNKENQTICLHPVRCGVDCAARCGIEVLRALPTTSPPRSRGSVPLSRLADEFSFPRAARDWCSHTSIFTGDPPKGGLYRNEGSSPAEKPRAIRPSGYAGFHHLSLGEHKLTLETAAARRRPARNPANHGVGGVRPALAPQPGARERAYYRSPAAARGNRRRGRRRPAARRRRILLTSMGVVTWMTGKIGTPAPAPSPAASPPPPANGAERGLNPKVTEKVIDPPTDGRGIRVPSSRRDGGARSPPPRRRAGSRLRRLPRRTPGASVSRVTLKSRPKTNPSPRSPGNARKSNQTPRQQHVPRAVR